MAKTNTEKCIENIESQLAKMDKQISDLGWEIKIIKSEAKELKEMLKNVKGELIPKDRYTMVEKIVFGLVGVALLALATAVINGVIR